MTSKPKAPGRPKQQPRGDYAIGFAKTAEHTKFKKGNQIGKLGGRPKGRRNDMTIVREILLSKLTSLADRDRSKLTVLEACILKLVESALKGTPRAFPEFKKLAIEAGLLQIEPPKLPQDQLQSHEQATLADFIASLAASGNPALAGSMGASSSDQGRDVDGER